MRVSEYRLDNQSSSLHYQRLLGRLPACALSVQPRKILPRSSPRRPSVSRDKLQGPTWNIKLNGLVLPPLLSSLKRSRLHLIQAIGQDIMSGLEPLAALGLVCNILQLVEAGGKIFGMAKTAYKEGRIDQKTAKEYATVLCQLSGEIRSKSDGAPTKLAPFERELVKTAKTCQDVSRDLLEDLTYLNTLASKGELLLAVKLAAKVAWRQRRLKRLEQSLKDVESRMQKSILGRVL